MLLISYLGFLCDSYEVELEFYLIEHCEKSRRSAFPPSLSPAWCQGPTFLRMVSGGIYVTLLCHLIKHSTASSLLTRIWAVLM